jgi:hypothetical protein
MILPKSNTLLLIVSFLLMQADIQASEILSFGNALFQKTFTAQTDQAGAIMVTIFDQNKTQVNNPDHAIFEFSINNEIVKSSDGIWQFLDISERKMGNGGSEYTLNFVIAKGPLIGLQASIIQQFFPESTLLREKLILSAKDQKSFQLSKLNGESNFHFPIYQVLSNAADFSNTHEIKLASWELKPTTFGVEEKGNHMYFPKITRTKLGQDKKTQKGPILITTDGRISWFTAYEHASQDDTKGMFDETKKSSTFIVDAMQGTKGVFNFAVTDDDFMFLGINTSRSSSAFQVGVSAMRGAYFENERIDPAHPYESVWSATAFYEGENLDEGKAILRNYILNQICEKPITREIEFYYNTWGLQRNDTSKPLRGILTYERIFEEIDYAAQLGVDIFVLDDGWEQTQGDWTPHRERFPQGLAPIKKKLDSLGIKMGLWLSPMGIDSTTQRYKDHPDWVIKDSDNKPILAQWGHPAFDFVGGFYDLFIEDCKKLIDQGCRFMKWDAINTFYSSLPNLEHGDMSVSEEERRARYEYLLPIYVTKAMEKLTNYEPELVIEIDITEARRVMTGLAVLSEGKFFWMNNGASGYNDYSTYRAQSMRTIINEYAELIPREVLTYANYPLNQEGALKYNTTNSILAGNGFWGNLQLMDSTERAQVGEMIQSAKQLQLDLFGIIPKVSGKVGDSPEIYSFYDDKTGAGQIIAFSTDPISKPVSLEIKTSKTLALLNTSYSLLNGKLNLDLNYKEGNASSFIPIISNEQKPFSIAFATSDISEAKLTNSGFDYKVKNQGQQIVRWGKSLGKPVVTSDGPMIYDISEPNNKDHYQIRIGNSQKDQVISVKKP